jgi:hypothetical protein
LLERWWAIIRIRREEREEWEELEELETGERGPPVDRVAEEHRARLSELLRELKSVAYRINDELREVESATAGMFFPPDQIAALSYMKARLEQDFVAARYEQRIPGDREMWTDAFDVEAGRWALHLTGTAVPTPLLAVYLPGNQVDEPPVLTLVRPAEGFEIVHPDSHRNGWIALPHGDSVMLVQGDEVWEVHFSFSNN